MRRKVWAFKKVCTQCGACCKMKVCDLGIIFLVTARTPCPALEFVDKKYWCGLVTNVAKYVFTKLNLNEKDYETIKNHILTVNNMGEGCDLDIWHIGYVQDMPLVGHTKAKRVTPLSDCSGKKYSKDEREDIARYILLGAELQRDATIQ